MRAAVGVNSTYYFLSSYNSFILIFYAITVLFIDSLFFNSFNYVSLSFNSFYLSSYFAFNSLTIPISLFIYVYLFLIIISSIISSLFISFNSHHNFTLSFNRRAWYHYCTSHSLFSLISYRRHNNNISTSSLFASINYSFSIMSLLNGAPNYLYSLFNYLSVTPFINSMYQLSILLSVSYFNYIIYLIELFSFNFKSFYSFHYLLSFICLSIITFTSFAISFKSISYSFHYLLEAGGTAEAPVRSAFTSTNAYWQHASYSYSISTN